MISLKDINKINYYICLTRKQNLSVRQLKNRIKNNEYERLNDKTQEKIINKESLDLQDNIKNPILIKNKYEYLEISEKMLQSLILENIVEFMKELGSGFSFVGNEFKINIGNSYNYIDLLLFNIIYNSYVVIELKVTELKKEHIG